MRRLGGHLALVAAIGVFLAVLWDFPAESQQGDALWHHRNLGKAFYENPTTGPLAVGEFRKALDLAPDSARERVNYGLALLRAGKTQDGIAELQRAQKQDPSIPHTWFNLGIAFKKDSQYDRAIAQFERMVTLVPDEPISHYNLGYLYKLADRAADAVREFELATKLNPNLAGPHFQLYNSYREAGRSEDAAREQALFQEIRRRNAGAAVPEDLDWSVYAEILDPVDPADAKDDGPAVGLKFADTTTGGPFTGEHTGVTTADIDADGSPDVIAWSAAGVRLFRKVATPVQNAELAALTGVRSVAPGDYDNDGFIDLAIVTGSGAVLFANTAGTLARATAALPGGAFAKALWVDYDHDYDLDLVLAGDPSLLLRNNGRAGFSDQTKDFPFVDGRATDAVAFNFVKDTDGHDILVTYAGRTAVLYRDQLAGKYRAEPVDALAAGAAQLVARDFDNDGGIDIAAGGTPGLTVLLNRVTRWDAAQVTRGAARAIGVADFENRAFADLVVDGVVVRNLAQGRFAPPGAAGLAGATAVATADFDNDGRVDMAAIAGGTLHLLHNQTPVSNTWTRIALAGVKNLRLALGAIVEVKAGPRYQKQMYAGAPLHFGLRDAAQIDAVRVTWPNGLIQNETKQPVGRPLAFKEAQRLSGSCPMIFTWNGREFQFITDVLGVAPLGASAGDGTYFPVDHDEYIQIPGEALVPRAWPAGSEDPALPAPDDRRPGSSDPGRQSSDPGGSVYEIRITEELREVAYIDQIRLIAVDHPRSIDIFTNDKFKAPPFPEFRLFGVEQRVYPVSARDGAGRDVRPALVAKDRRYPDGFRRDYAGVAELHTLDLDFGKAAPDNRAVLILSGWVDWADGSTFLAAAQEDSRGLIFPSIQVKDAAGQWKTVVDDMGIPAGKPKTIAVDLTGKFLSASREIRIVTNLCLYWDEIFLGGNPDAPAVVTTAIDPAAADLRFRGFSTPAIHPERKQPESFDYQRRMPLSMWNQTPGLYTRYGDVLPLATAIDDRMIVMGSGDEIRLLFAASSLPALKPGWRRDYLLFVDGWAKDGDANTAFSRTVEPLPFHGMSSYPFQAGEDNPNTLLHREYRGTYNTRPALRLLRPLSLSSTLDAGAAPPR